MSRRRHARLVVWAVVACLMSAGSVAHGQSPTPSALAASPSPAPFPWPTLLPPSAPVDAFNPSGPPDASVTRHGMIVELWLSSDHVAPGELVEAVVRVTNTRAEPAYGLTGPCLSRPLMASDLTGVIAPGDPQSGNAAEFKRRLIDGASLMTAVWERASSRQVARDTGIVVLVLADCGATGRTFDRVGPRRTLEQRWSWYPADPVDGGAAWLRPLPPGKIRVTFTWLHAGRGPEPPSDDVVRGPAPLMASTELDLTGEDRGLLSMPELADRALADPEFRAWVDQAPGPEAWDDADLRAWADTGDIVEVAPPDLETRAPHGVVAITLARTPAGSSTVEAFVWLDPWTGDVLGFTKEP